MSIRTLVCVSRSMSVAFLYLTPKLHLSICLSTTLL